MAGDDLSKDVAKVVRLEENFRAADSKDHTGATARTTEQALQDEIARINGAHKNDKNYLRSFANALTRTDETKAPAHGAVYPTVEFDGNSLVMKPLKTISAETSEATRRRHDGVGLDMDKLAEQNAQTFRADLNKEGNRARYKEIYGLPANATDDQIVKMHSQGSDLQERIYELGCLARGIDIHGGPNGKFYDASKPQDKAKLDALIAENRRGLSGLLNEINAEHSWDKTSYAQHLAGGLSDIYTFDRFGRPPKGALTIGPDGKAILRPELNTPKGLLQWAEKHAN